MEGAAWDVAVEETVVQNGLVTVGVEAQDADVLLEAGVVTIVKKRSRCWLGPWAKNTDRATPYPGRPLKPLSHRHTHTHIREQAAP